MFRNQIDIFVGLLGLLGLLGLQDLTQCNNFANRYQR